MSSTLTNLTAATTWSGTDLFYALVGGNSRKIAAAKFLVAETSSSLAMQDSTTAQTFRIYRTFTDSSNYERLALTSSSGAFELTAESAGTGTDDMGLKLTTTGLGQLSVVSPGAAIGTMRIQSTSASGFSTVDCYNESTVQKAGFGYANASAAGSLAGHAFFYTPSGTIFHFRISGHDHTILTTGEWSLFNDLVAPAGGSTAARVLLGSTSTFGVYIGSGAPSVSAGQGSLYLRTDGSSTSTRLYVNTTGSTTWTNVTTAT